MSALRTSLARTEVAIDSDLAEHGSVLEIERGGVTQLARIFDFAAKRHREPVILRLEIDSRTIRGAADREKAIAVRQFDELRENDAGRPESHVDVPDRARAAILGEMKRSRVEALGNIPGLVDAKKEERHALRAGSLERPVSRRQGSRSYCQPAVSATQRPGWRLRACVPAPPSRVVGAGAEADGGPSA